MSEPAPFIEPAGAGLQIVLADGRAGEVRRCPHCGGGVSLPNIAILDRELVRANDRTRELEHLWRSKTLYPISDMEQTIASLRGQVMDLREALNRAGNRLAQVQPAIDTACTWALDIVPNATREIAAALLASALRPDDPHLHVDVVKEKEAPDAG